VKPIAFTYYSNAVSDIFLKNVETFLYYSGKYDSLVICSDIPLPKTIISALCEIIQVIKISPNEQSISLKKKFSSNSNPTIVNPFILTALSYSEASDITVFDPHVFLIKDIDLTNNSNQFFFSQNSLISTSFFKFKPSSEISRLANQILINQDYTNISIIQAFNFFITNSLAFSEKSIRSDLFIFTRPSDEVELKEDKILGFDFLNLSRTSHFKEISGIRDNHVAKKKKQLLAFIKKKYQYLDQSLVTATQNNAAVPISYENFKKYSDKLTNTVQINLIYTKQVANHAKNLEKTLTELGFIVKSSIKSPGSALNPNDPNLHIVMCPNVFTDFPKNYIAYQFEQAHSSWFTKDYIHRLNCAIEIWDYSEYNINYFKGKFGRPHIFVPIGRVEHDVDIVNQARDIDVLFYGEYSGSSRRTEFLDSMRELRSIKVVDGFSVHKFGSDIVDILKRTKVVLNHHYYDNGNLEVVRVYEALSYGCKVVSEVSVDDNYHDLPILRYSSVTEADRLLKLALADNQVREFNKSNKAVIKSAMSRLGFNMHNRIAVFAHYDVLNQIDDYVVDYLTKLSKFCDKIIFVSDGNVNPSELEKISHLISDSICGRHGESNDLGSYKRGFNLIIEKYKSDISKIDQFLFVNDSGYCVGDLTPVFDTMTGASVDAWALCDHAPDPKLIEGKCYLQSNFFSVNRAVFTAKPFSQFMNSITVSHNKSEIVDKYELGLSEMLIKNGYRTGCYISTVSLDEYIRSNDTQLTTEVLSLLSGNYSGITSDIMSRIFHSKIGGDYVYSDHFYTLLKIGFPLIKCLALVPNQETGPYNKLIDYWKPILISKLGSAQVNQMLTHISRIGKTPKSPNKNIR
jgi:hypothetical protein